jgi:hypothetical protein
MYLLNITQNFQCDLSNVLLNESLEGFEVHPSSFEFFKCDLNNMFSSGGVVFKVFPQSFNCCLHCHINTMSLFRPPTNFKYIKKILQIYAYFWLCASFG